MSRFGSPERRLPPVLAPLRGPGQQSQRHGATQTRPWSAIPKTRRHSRDTPTSNPQNTAPPRPRLCQQSPRHGATQTTALSAIFKTRRYPDNALISNPQDTAPPARHAQQQSAWHSGTHATRPAAIPMAQRHPRDPPSSNPHGTAAPTRPAEQQSPWHSATHATHATRPRRRSPRHSGTHTTCPAAIPMAQCHTRHTRHAPETQIRMAQRHPHDLPASNPHGTAPHGTRATRPKHRSAWHGINDAPRRDATRDDATRLAMIARAHSKRSEHGSSPQTPRL